MKARLATPAASLLVLVLALLVAGGCGGSDGPPAVSDVTACLKKAGMTVEDATKTEKDKDVVDGVFATTDFSGGDVSDLTFAVAATVKTAAVVDKFEKDAKDLSKDLEQGGKDRLVIESGSDDKYVWVVAGTKKNDAFKKARSCVKP